MLDWIQSFEGIITMSLGGVSLGTIVTFATVMFKNAKSMSSARDLISAVKEAKEVASKQEILINKQNKTLEERELEIEIRKENEAMLLKSMSIVIASSSGIDAVSKINFLNELKTSREKIKSFSISALESVKDVAEEKVVELKKEVIEKGTQVLDETIKEVSTLVNKYSKK